MKILCLCNHGNIRSACLSQQIKGLNGPLKSTGKGEIKKWMKFQAIAIGAHSNDIETIQYFTDWADKVIDLSDNDFLIQNRLKTIAQDKYHRFDIGQDIWRNSNHPKLIKICKRIIHKII